MLIVTGVARILESTMESRAYYLITPLAYTGSAKAFTYHHDGDRLKPGQIVQITIGRRLLSGVVESAVAKPSFSTKAITQVLDLSPIPSDLHELARWTADYYAASPASVWSTMLPAGLAKKRRENSAPKIKPAHGLPTTPLTSEQSSAINHILTDPAFSHLLQGVTGSGKTRVYLELAAQAVARGQSVIILVPEITLTPGIIAQFEHAFGDLVLASHSKLTEATRHKIWLAAAQATTSSKPRIIIGPRSCLFMPVFNLGLIVIDESHEPSYKQDNHPHYHAVMTAARRCQLTGAKLLLGSATPGLTELFLAKSGRIQHLFMHKKVNKISHPEATIIDLRNKNLFKKSKFIAQPLLEAVEQTLAQSRQSLLYLNRRGSASSQVCTDCGAVTACPNCTLPLTFHADLLKFLCHHCNFRTTVGAICPQCGSNELKLLGGGTKRVEQEIAQLFPHARLARLDKDSATLPYLKSVLAGLKQGNIDILIGTQMIAKGLDFPAVDTVGIISADTMLHLPDFSAAERTYQLIVQASGRAGRGDQAGRVFIQTYTPDHPAIQAAASNDYAQFAETELAERQALGYPPYTFLLKLTVSTAFSQTALAQAASFASVLRKQAGITVIGPAPAFIEHQAGKYHWIITVSSKQRSMLTHIATHLPSEHWSADLDPTNLL